MKSSDIPIFIFTFWYDDVIGMSVGKWGMNLYLHFMLVLMQKEFWISIYSFSSYVHFYIGRFLQVLAYARARRFLRFFARASVNIGPKWAGKVSNDGEFIQPSKSIEKTTIFTCIKGARVRA